MDEAGLSERLNPVKEELKNLVAEAQELRSEVFLPEVQATPTEHLEALHEVRQVLDRVEEIYIRTIKLRAAVTVMHNQISNGHDDSWDEIVSKSKNAAVQKGSDFTGPRERYAEANMMTIESKRRVRIVSEVLDFCGTMVEIVKIIKYGLEGVRGDVLAMIRVWQIESSLER